MVNGLILIELIASLILFLTVLSLLVGGTWTSIFTKDEFDSNRENWVLRNLV